MTFYKEEDRTYVCTMCIPGYTYLGSLGDMVLIEYENKWILCDDSEGRDQAAVFTYKPYPDYFELLSEEEQEAVPFDDDATWEQFDQWHTIAEIQTEQLNKLDLQRSWNFIESLKKAGWNHEEDMFAALWVFHMCGLIIKEYEENNGYPAVQAD